MERYYYMSSGCLKQYIETQKIRDYLLSNTLFHETEEGTFFCKSPFIDISLMNVKNIECYSSNDYDTNKINYISIIIEESDRENNAIILLFMELEKITGWSIVEDIC